MIKIAFSRAAAGALVMAFASTINERTFRSERKCGANRRDQLPDLALQLLKGERFDDVVVATGLDAVFQVGVAKHRCRGQNRDFFHGRMSPNLASGLPAIHSRHHDVHDDEFRLFRQRFLNAFGAAFGADGSQAAGRDEESGG